MKGIAAHLKVNLILIPIHGFRGLARAMMGSRVERLVRLAPCPVMTVTTRWALPRRMMRRRSARRWTSLQPQGVRRQIDPAYPRGTLLGASGIGNWDQPRHTTCRGRPIWENPTYSAFWSVFGVTCLRLERLASSMGFGTAGRLGPSKNLPYSGVTPEPVVC
jgi:hypothetical protein